MTPPLEANERIEWIDSRGNTQQGLVWVISGEVITVVETGNHQLHDITEAIHKPRRIPHTIESLSVNQLAPPLYTVRVYLHCTLCKTDSEFTEDDRFSDDFIFHHGEHLREVIIRQRHTFG